MKNHIIKSFVIAVSTLLILAAPAHAQSRRARQVTPPQVTPPQQRQPDDSSAQQSTPQQTSAPVPDPIQKQSPTEVAQPTEKVAETTAEQKPVTPAQGRLGKTIEEIEAKYGTEKKDPMFGGDAEQFGSLRFYESHGFNILVSFNEVTKLSQMERFQGDLTQAKVDVLMEAFGGGKTWIPGDVRSSGIDQYWGATSSSGLNFNNTRSFSDIVQGYRLSDDSIRAIAYGYTDPGTHNNFIRTIIFMTKEFAQIDQVEKRAAAGRERLRIMNEKLQKQREIEKENERKKMEGLF